MIKHIVLIYLTLALNVFAIAQKSVQTLRSYGPGFCDSIKEITEEYYESHQRKLSIIDTTDLPPKKGNRIAVKFGKDSVVFKDKSYETDSGYMLYHAIIGIDKKRDCVLVQSSDEITSIYYLIHPKNMVIDTFVGYPYLVANKIISVEEEHTDFAGYIQVRKIQNGKTKIIFTDYFRRCEHAERPQRFAITSENEFMFYGWGKYWLVKGALF